jgi:hypothetical protein
MSLSVQKNQVSVSAVTTYSLSQKRSYVLNHKWFQFPSFFAKGERRPFQNNGVSVTNETRNFSIDLEA